MLKFDSEVKVMRDSTKEIIIKTITVICCIFGLFMILIPIIAAMLDGRYFELGTQQTPLPQPFYFMWLINIILFFISGIILMILLPIFGLKQKAVKADRVPLPYASFEELTEFLQSALDKRQYQGSEQMSLNEHDSIRMFTRRKLWKLDCFSIIRCSELSEELLELANDKITEFLIGYYGTERIIDWVDMITLVCVDRITPPFQKFVNSNMQQGFKNARLSVGASFGGKTLYIAKQKDGFAIAKYKKLKKEFFAVMDIPHS